MSKPLVVGHGPTRILALHGWFGSAAGWGPLAAVVDTRRFTYAFMDCRGYGSRKHVRGTFDMDEIARDALETADLLGWDRFNLVGHSMGGKAIQRVLMLAPERIDRMTAITPVPASGAGFDAATRAIFDGAATSLEARKGIIAHSVGNRLSPHWVDSMARRSLEHATEEAFSRYLRAWADGDFSSEVAGHPVRIQVIVGRHDPSITEALMRGSYLASYPHAELEVLDNAGHYPMDETPVALATLVERFLGRNEG